MINALAFDYQRMTSLPYIGTCLVINPFVNTVIDYTGHIFAADESGDMRKM